MQDLWQKFELQNKYTFVTKLLIFEDYKETIKKAKQTY